MANYLDYLPRKSFNTHGVVVLLLFVLFNFIIIAISGVESTVELQCHLMKNSKEKDISSTNYIEIMCSHAYQERSKFGIVSTYAMLILNFAAVFIPSVIYAFLVKSRVEKFDYQTVTETTTNGDDEHQPIHAYLNTSSENPLYVNKFLGHFSTFFIYIVHLIVARIFVSLVFAFGLFYPAQIPKNFSCPWRIETQGKGPSTLNDTDNSRYIDCINPNAERSRNLYVTVAMWNVFFVALPAILELIYIASVAFIDRNFVTDQEFCTVYLLRKRKRIRNYVNKVRATLNQNLVRDISGGSLGEIYVNVVLKEGREDLSDYPSEFNRDLIYQRYLHPPKTATELRSTADIFKPNKGDPTYPRTILVIGRPGIGKTMLTRKISHEWKVNEDKFWLDKMVILLRCCILNKKTVTFREMLCYGEAITSANFQTMYEFVLLNPTNTIFIFDGLDELTGDDELLAPEERTIFSDEKMPVLSIFQSLLHGKLLPGVTILATSRPTADHFFSFLDFERTVEILGFSEEQIKKYVFKFCKNEQYTSELIWNQINESVELRSLCYIPIVNFIICLTLKSSIEYNERKDQLGESSNGNISITITEIYKRAVKFLLYNHHPIYKLPGKERPKGYLSKPLPEELEKELIKMKKLAKYGISKGILFYELDTSVKENDFVNCGLLSQMENKERDIFCFLHLTLQEFLAALQVVDDMDNVHEFSNMDRDDPRWRLVIQFVDGLVGDKINKF